MTHWSEWNKSHIALYTLKWFGLWSFKLFALGFIALGAIMTFLIVCMGNRDEPS